MFEENKPTDETFSEGSDIPPIEEESSESPIKEYFDGLSEEEKDELASICESYVASKGEEGYLKGKGKEPIDFTKVEKELGDKEMD